MPKESNLRELFWPYVLKIKVRHIEADKIAQTKWFKLVPFKLFSLLKRYKPAKKINNNNFKKSRLLKYIFLKTKNQIQNEIFISCNWNSLTK